VLLNMAWTAQNLLILGAATAVASEARQVRHNHRIPMRLAATLHLPGGRTMACETENFSEGGLSVILPTSLEIEQQQRLNISLYRGNEEFVFPIEAVRINDLQLSLKFHDLSLQQETDLVQCSFARANAWVDSWGRAKQDQPLRALRQIFRIGAGGIKELLHQFSSEIHDGLRRKTKTPSTTESA
jgi:cellulose synthase (UDP-forming)